MFKNRSEIGQENNCSTLERVNSLTWDRQMIVIYAGIKFFFALVTRRHLCIWRFNFNFLFRPSLGNTESPDSLPWESKSQGPDVPHHVRVKTSRSLLLPFHRKLIHSKFKARACSTLAAAASNPQSFGSAQAAHAFKRRSLSWSAASSVQKYWGSVDDDWGDWFSWHDVHVWRRRHLSGELHLTFYVQYSGDLNRVRYERQNKSAKILLPLYSSGSVFSVYLVCRRNWIIC